MMGGAAPLGVVGAGYIVVGKEPMVTIKEMLGKFHVCIKRNATWKEIVGEFGNREHAELFVVALASGASGLKTAVIQYILHYGLEHEDDCPEDDTCECILVQAIEDALKPMTTPPPSGTRVR